MGASVVKTIKRYRVEWIHNYQWRMAWDHHDTYDTKEKAIKASKGKDFENIETRIVKVLQKCYKKSLDKSKSRG